VKIGAVLLFATFSYIIVLGMIQLGEILMRFFIERVGGQDLFNIIFTGPNSVDNYKNFIGLRDLNFCNQESAATSILLVKLTSLTYNIISFLLIFRKILLWFMLILSPFLALLMPFIFIRNTGWVWIGVFFQWLFYGPLVSLFMAALTRIWIAGIPYSFNFAAAGKPEGMVYRTAINILYGGPAQVVTPTNSANYIDTYAEYVIALIMLWTAIILPWLLLRIFRDYCCEVMEASRSTLSAMYERMRTWNPPPPPTPNVGPTTTAGMAFDLPFRKAADEFKTSSIAALGEISKANTRQIVSALDLSVSSLKDVSRLEMDNNKRQEALGNLNKLASPDQISQSVDRQRFSSIRSELMTRASQGDKTASSIISASERKVESYVSSSTIGGPAAPYAPKKMASVSTGGLPTVSLPKVSAKQVSIEDYEDVKKMWLNHYREAPVPVSDKIKKREDWLSEDVKKLTNTINLLASSDPKLKQKGMDDVAEILPFLLLGGFSETETITYLKAKLEAAKQISKELEVKEELKEEVAEEMKKEEEEVVEVTPKKKEEAKAETLTEKKELPEEEKKPFDSSQGKEEKTQSLKDTKTEK